MGTIKNECDTHGSLRDNKHQVKTCPSRTSRLMRPFTGLSLNRLQLNTVQRSGIAFEVLL
jgi:hypothetical protein